MKQKLSHQKLPIYGLQRRCSVLLEAFMSLASSGTGTSIRCGSRPIGWNDVALHLL